MIYFIAYLLQGEPKAFHEKLVKEIAEKFDVHYRDQKKIPSHITLKEPFKTNRIEEVEKLLELFAKKHHSSALKIEGFSHFDDNVIFQNIHPSQQATKLINALLKELKKLPWMQWQRQKSKELTLHATLAYRDIKPKFNDIWNYVNKIDYNETISLDKITILKHENNAWHIHKEYLLL